MAIDPAEIKLTPEQRRFVAERADKTGRPWPELLEELVPSTIPATADFGVTAHDVARRLGLLGMSDEGASDLATNPTYLEGFGESDNGTSSD
jgi:hypothetical protein